MTPTILSLVFCLPNACSPEGDSWPVPQQRLRKVHMPSLSFKIKDFLISWRLRRSRLHHSR